MGGQDKLTPSPGFRSVVKTSWLLHKRFNGFLGHRKVVRAEDSWLVHSFEGPLVQDSKGHCEAL